MQMILLKCRNICPVINRLICIILSAFFVFTIPVQADTGGIQAGVAQTNITPPMGFRMAGYYHERLASGVHDELYAKALVLDDGTDKIVLVICDNIRPFPAAYDAAMKRIQNELNIPAEHIIIAGTHTHTGPRMIEPYDKILSVKIADAVLIANRRLQPAVIKAGAGREENISYNRRFLLKDGTVKTNPGILNPDVVRPVGPIDPEIGILFIETIQGKPLAALVNFALHLDTVGGTEISADYPYYIEQILQKVTREDMPVLFGIGPCGNINHVNVMEREEFPGLYGRRGKTEQIGYVLAGGVIQALPSLELQENGDVQAVGEIVPLAIQQFTQEEIARAEREAQESTRRLSTRRAMKILKVQTLNGGPLEARVHVFRIGDTAIVSLPGEIFVELGLAIKEQSPFKHTLIIENALSDVGYIPDDKAFDEGSYEVEVSRIQRGEGEKLVEAAVRLLNKVK